MSELFRNFKETVTRYKRFAEQNEETSENIQELLATGKIEELVQEYRAPVRIGWISFGPNSSQDDSRMSEYYEIPPAGFKAEDIVKVYESMGVHIFVNKLGVERVGITYTLNHDQAAQVEERVQTENLRLGRNINK